MIYFQLQCHTVSLTPLGFLGLAIYSFSPNPAMLCACPCNSGAAVVDVRPANPPHSLLTQTCLRSCMLSNTSFACTRHMFDNMCMFVTACILCALFFYIYTWMCGCLCPHISSMYMYILYSHHLFSVPGNWCVCLRSMSLCVFMYYMCINIPLSVCQACGTVPPR